MAVKNYYIVESRSACLGSQGTVKRLPYSFTNKRLALQKCKEIKTDKYTILWVDFE